MSAVHTGLSLLNAVDTNGSARRHDSAQTGVAWQREMERAQMSAWTQPAPIQPVTAPPPVAFTLFGQAFAAAGAGFSPFGDVEGAPAIDPAGARGLPGEPEPVRLHAQHTPHGVAVWLGLDAGDTGIETRMAAILEQLRSALAGRGLRLAQLVCNGRVVFEAGSGPAGAPQTHQFNRIYNQEA